MNENQTKGYYYSIGGLIVAILVLRHLMDQFHQFGNVLLCSLVLFILLVGLFYYGLCQTSQKRLLGRPRTMLAYLISSIYVFILLIPLGLFGFSNFIKFSVPISGSQFTWITVNRYVIAISAIIIYVILALVGIFLSKYQLGLLSNPSDRPLEALRKTIRQMSWKSCLMKLLTVLGMLLSVTLLTLLMAEVNRLVINRGMFLLSQGLIDVVSIGIELIVISRLLGIQFTRIHHGALVTSFGLALIIFAGLMTGLNPAYNAKPTAKPTIIVHRGVINHNAKGNTIASLTKNSQYHFPYVEMDIQETRDHQFICAHDDDIRIPGRGLQEVNRLDLATIKRYHHVDMFGDYLKTANRLGQPLIIELKVTNQSDRLMGVRFADQFGSQMTKLPHRVHSIGYPFLCQIKRKLPTVKVGLVTMLNFADISRYQVDFYTLQHITANPFLIATVGRTGRQVYSWTDDSRFSMLRMAMLGVTGQVTDQAFRLQNLRINYRQDRWLLLLNSLHNYL